LKYGLNSFGWGGCFFEKASKKKKNYIGSLDLRLGFHGMCIVGNTIAVLEYTDVVVYREDSNLKCSLYLAQWYCILCVLHYDFHGKDSQPCNFLYWLLLIDKRLKLICHFRDIEAFQIEAHKFYKLYKLRNILTLCQSQKKLQTIYLSS